MYGFKDAYLNAKSHVHGQKYKAKKTRHRSVRYSFNLRSLRVVFYASHRVNSKSLLNSKSEYLVVSPMQGRRSTPPNAPRPPHKLQLSSSISHFSPSTLALDRS